MSFKFGQFGTGFLRTWPPAAALRFRDLVNRREHPPDPPPPRVMITFDDAFVDVHENGLPILVRHGVPAVVYAVVSEIGRRDVIWPQSLDPGPFDFADADRLRDMADHGCEIGSHTMDHRRLGSMTLGERRDSLATSRRRLEDLVRSPILSVAYPYGDHDASTPALAREAGYGFGVTVVSGVNAPDADPYTLRRCGAKGTRIHHPAKFARAMRRRLEEVAGP